MDPKAKAKRVGIAFIVLFIVAGLVLMYTGSDAVVLATRQKEGILTAEQVKMSFDSVSGRLVREAVREGDEVRAGDVVMELDATDNTLALARVDAQLAQIEAQIARTKTAMGISMQQVDTNETQSFRGIDRQRAALDAARATEANSARDYERMAALFAEGAVSKEALDNAEMRLSVARAATQQQAQNLAQLLGGAADTGNTESLSLPTIEQARQSAANMGNDVAALEAQRDALLVQKKELEVARDRLVLRAPEDGKVLKLLAKEGEMISPGRPVVLLESSRSYYDIYVSEAQVQGIHEGDRITGHAVAGDRAVQGTVRLVAKAPGFADLKMTREKSQADLSAFQIRIYVDPTDGIIPGMTIGVSDRAFTES
ncbi:HlyD family secretion protein [Selenomonas artemidis]|uniref:HlyD family secretion protein n=1 Tax=Selenomonas artemidis TaxID=671224 RepID=UPI002889FCE8|nr:HlyD family efflux transporter periplasmic adaptor subunit [Selenomonas artemidis]